MPANTLDAANEEGRIAVQLRSVPLCKDIPTGIFGDVGKADWTPCDAGRGAVRAPTRDAPTLPTRPGDPVPRIGNSRDGRSKAAGAGSAKPIPDAAGFREVGLWRGGW